MIQGYLDAVDWLFSHNINFDWLINLTGQDYPTQPLSRIEKFLAETKYDGFLEYFETLSDCQENLYGQREGCDRYLYQYWRSGIYLLLFGTDRSLRSKILNRLGLLCKQFNNGQNFSRICWVFDGIMIGFRAKSNPFHKNFICYGGSYFHTISSNCVQFLFDFSKQNPALVNYYKKTCVPVESFIQTVLVNSGLFNFCNDYKRFIDFPRGELGSPCILTFADYQLVVKDDIHFARKFDMMQDRKILDMLDARILEFPYGRNK